MPGVRRLPLMNRSGIVELVAGLATAALAIGGKAYILSPPPVSAADYLRTISASTLAATLVAAGAYAHVVKSRTWGHVLLLLGSGYLIFELLRLVLLYRWMLNIVGAFLGLMLFAPGVMASLTAAVSLLNRRSLRPRRA